MKSRRSLFLLAACVVTLIIVFSGCSAIPGRTEDAAEPAPEPAMPDERGRSEADAPAQKPDHDVTMSADIAGQMVIRNAHIFLQVRSPEDSMKHILDLVEESGGYVSDTTQSQVGEQRVRIQITARVPAEHFDDLYAAIGELGTVTQRRSWSTDVTEEYIDLSARLNNLRSEEEALRSILEEARSVDEMLSVRRHLTEVRGQIESLQGRLQYLEDRAAYSTFNIELHPETLPGAAISAVGFDDFLPRLASAIIRGCNLVLNVTSTVILFTATALPALLAAALVISVVWVGVRRIRSS